MTEITSDKLEVSEHRTKLWGVLGVAGFLLVLVQGAFTYFITNSATEMRETNRNLIEVTAAMRVVQVQLTYLQKQVDDLQASKKEAGQVHQVLETRLASTEQRLALHDQWMQAHNK